MTALKREIVSAWTHSHTAVIEVGTAMIGSGLVGFAVALFLLTSLTGLAALLSYVGVAIVGMSLWTGWRKRAVRHKLFADLVGLIEGFQAR